MSETFVFHGSPEEADRLASRLDDETQLTRQFYVNKRTGGRPCYDGPLPGPPLCPMPQAFPSTGAFGIGGRSCPRAQQLRAWADRERVRLLAAQGLGYCLRTIAEWPGQADDAVFALSAFRPEDVLDLWAGMIAGWKAAERAWARTLPSQRGQLETPYYRSLTEAILSYLGGGGFVHIY